MIIFGTRLTRRVLATLTYTCESCRTTAAHHLVRQQRKFTLFFVPLFPVGTRHLDTCTYCGRTLEVSKEQAETAAAQAPVR